MPNVSVHPLLPNIKPTEVRAILGAMRAIAETGGVLPKRIELRSEAPTVTSSVTRRVLISRRYRRSRQKS